MTGAVLVVGAGISGIQSALDLAEMGFKVYLVERQSAIGGRMSMLDKTFPTNDCSMCILSPKLVECGRHPNIEILTYADVIDFKGEPGKYEVTIRKRPRYVDEKKCVGCGSCAEECPREIKNNFDYGLGTRKAIYKLYPQAYPNAYVIDWDNCIGCYFCQDYCDIGAIDYFMEEKTINLTVGAVILSPGLEPFNAEIYGEYGFGLYKNVLTSLQFESMLSASGATQGHVQRPSDGKIPRKIAFIQCVGSRNAAKNHGYCSSVCCMYATKEAVIAKEHIPGLETTIFCADVRAFGKDFERYYNRASTEHGVEYVRCMLSSVTEMPENRNLLLRYRTSEGKYKEEEFDLVILSVGLKPTQGAVELAKVLDLKLNKYNFCRTKELSGVETSQQGIYVAGTFSGPKDIPETVVQASAAAGSCAAGLADVRNSMVEERKYPPEKNVYNEIPRVGVFVCHCGLNIGRVVDIPKVLEYVKGLPNVAYVQDTVYACAQDTQVKIGQLIEEYNLNRIVVASCTPRTHEPLFQEMLRESGLNPHLFEMVNIREHCSWVHMHRPGEATAKAMELIKMGVAKASLLAPVKPLTLEVTSEALIAGGGISGMTCAINLAEQGYKVHLVEKSGSLGGMAKRLKYGLNGELIEEYLSDLITTVNNNSMINVYLNSDISEASGYVGNFRTVLSSGEEIVHGAAILAVGGEEYKPREYLYGKNRRVFTLLELENALYNKEALLNNVDNVVLIQCVGSREPERPYCSRTCCTKSVKLALQLKEINPDINVYILYRDIRTYGLFEDYYYQARAKGIIFIRYTEDNKPEVREDWSKIEISVYDPVLGQSIIIDADLVGLAAAIVPSQDNNKLSQIYKTPLNQDGFFLEAHLKLRPVDFFTDGVFMCGLAHSPQSIEESITQAKAAAGRAGTVLGKKTIEAQGQTAFINRVKCTGCGTCINVCPFSALTIDGKDSKVAINEALCKGCGACASSCRCNAIDIKGFANEQIIAMLNVL